MPGFVVVIVIAAGFAVMELRRLWKKGWKKEAAILAVFTILGSAMCLPIVKRAYFPRPLYVLEFVYKPIADLFFSIF